MSAQIVATIGSEARMLEQVPISRTPSRPRPRPPAEAESTAGIAELRGAGRAREEAVARLHALLLRAARFEGSRRRAGLPHLSAGELDDLALQSADDALVAVLSKLDEFAGRSRFTTWAYKFALLEMSVKLRRRPWQAREVPVDFDVWPGAANTGDTTAHEVEGKALLADLREAIEQELTPHQREVLVGVAVNCVPIDVLAERLESNRGALYKTIHDARRKLRRRLEADGHDLPGSESGGAA